MHDHVDRDGVLKRNLIDYSAEEQLTTFINESVAIRKNMSKKLFGFLEAA